MQLRLRQIEALLVRVVEVRDIFIGNRNLRRDLFIDQLVYLFVLPNGEDGCYRTIYQRNLSRNLCWIEKFCCKCFPFE